MNEPVEKRGAELEGLLALDETGAVAIVAAVAEREVGGSFDEFSY